jgi:hypothetical protein
MGPHARKVQFGLFCVIVDQARKHRRKILIAEEADIDPNITINTLFVIDVETETQQPVLGCHFFDL